MKDTFECGPWHVQFAPADGARLQRLTYDGFDLLTSPPENFTMPASDLGEYEKRPVYGYDDCFPSLGRCRYPGREWNIPDHGELCWLNWKSGSENGRLSFQTRSNGLPVTFARGMRFSEKSVVWRFEVTNHGTETIPFLHVMHPLIRLSEITWMDFPSFEEVIDFSHGNSVELSGGKAVADFLLAQSPGTAVMLFLRRIDRGEMSWRYRSGLGVKSSFPASLFPTIGIWWNNKGYPDEDGLRRDECAFEPLPGFRSVLSEAYDEGHYLSVKPASAFSWEIEWEIRV
jgi:hypothetical protein